MSRGYNLPKRPWSKLKNRVEALWEPSLKLAIHCTVYVNKRFKGYTFESPRHWIALNKEIIWDFPSMFLAWKHPDVPKPVEYLDEGYLGMPKSDISMLLCQYIDTPRNDLLSGEFPEDHWELIDILRAADRRLGRENLLEWGATLAPSAPARKVLAARFGHS